MHRPLGQAHSMRYRLCATPLQSGSSAHNHGSVERVAQPLENAKRRKVFGWLPFFALVGSAENLGFAVLPKLCDRCRAPQVYATGNEFVSMKRICPILNRPTEVDETGFHQEA